MNDLANWIYAIFSEHVERISKKVYCTVLFSQHLVFKFFDRKSNEYDLAAIASEYYWDCQMPYLQPILYDDIVINNNHFSLIVMYRIPQTSNVLYNLLCNQLSNEELIEIGNKIWGLTSTYQICNMTSNKLYSNYISNINLQLSYLHNLLSPSIMRDLSIVINNRNIQSFFVTACCNKSARQIHGNLFSGNIFYHNNDLILIDPISINHIARESLPEMDIASYLTDIFILLPYERSDTVMRLILSPMQDWEKHIVLLYLLLKILVRIRFAYLELDLDRDEYAFRLNTLIVDTKEILLKRVLTSLTKQLPLAN